MLNHDYSASHQDDQGSSTEWAPNEEQSLEQEESRYEGQDESHQGMVPVQDSGHEPIDLQEHGVPQQDDVDTQPRGAGESIDSTMDQPGDETPGTSPAEPPEREVVPVPSKSLGSTDE